MTTDSPLSHHPSASARTSCGDTTVFELPLDEWIALPPHPRSRDARRAARAPHWETARTATGVLLEAMRHVQAVEYCGQMYKLKGNTRSALWTASKLPRPSSVLVTALRTDDPDAFAALYAAVHPPTGVLKAVDRAFGAYRAAGLTLTSRRLRDGTINDALNIALRGCAAKHQAPDAVPIDVYKAVALFANALQALDDLAITPELFQSGVLAAALLTITLDPDDGAAFFVAVARRQGAKQAGLNDPVEALINQIEAAPPSRARWLRKQQEKLFAQSLAAYERWRHGETNPGTPPYWNSSPLQRIDVSPYIERLRAKHQLDRCVDL